MITKEAFQFHNVICPLNVAEDGVEAIEYLRFKQQKGIEYLPNLIILDLNLPRKSGQEVLEEIKSDKVLKKIPVVILTTSKAQEDILKAYTLHANCFITKPLDFNKFKNMIKTVIEFWLEVTTLPNHKGKQ